MAEKALVDMFELAETLSEESAAKEKKIVELEAELERVKGGTQRFIEAATASGAHWVADGLRAYLSGLDLLE